MTPVDFARELAAALAASLPVGFSAEADGVLVTIAAPDGTGATTSLEMADGDDLDACADAAEAVLSLAQDVVSEALDAPWPMTAGAGVDLPIPGARVEGSSLWLWYGDADAPVLAIRAMPLC